MYLSSVLLLEPCVFVCAAPGRRRNVLQQQPPTAAPLLHKPSIPNPPPGLLHPVPQPTPAQPRRHAAGRRRPSDGRQGGREFLRVPRRAWPSLVLLWCLKNPIFHLPDLPVQSHWAFIQTSCSKGVRTTLDKGRWLVPLSKNTSFFDLKFVSSFLRDVPLRFIYAPLLLALRAGPPLPRLRSTSSTQCL